MRQRIIFIGVREDLAVDPVHPEPLGYGYSVRDALPWITQVAVNRTDYVPASSVPARTVQASTGGRTSSTLSGEPLGYVEAPVGTNAGQSATELTGRVGSKFKRKRISLDGPLNTVNAQGAGVQRFELTGRAIHNTGNPN